jgi:hypothetical protein
LSEVADAFFSGLHEIDLMDKRRDRGLSVKETTDSPSAEFVDCHSITQWANKQPPNKATPSARVVEGDSDAMTVILLMSDVQTGSLCECNASDRPRTTYIEG